MDVNKYVDLENIRKEINERTESGDMLNLSIDRAKALRDMAKLYVANDGKGIYSIPTSEFTDTEIILWELFLNAIRFGRRLDNDMIYITEL